MLCDFSHLAVGARADIVERIFYRCDICRRLLEKNDPQAIAIAWAERTQAWEIEPWERATHHYCLSCLARLELLREERKLMICQGAAAPEVTSESTAPI